MQYTQPSSGAFAKAHEVLMNENSFTKQDLLLQVRTKDKRAMECVKLHKGIIPNKSSLMPFFECTLEEDED